jgi:twinkle protein
MDLQYTYEYLPWRNIDASVFRFYDVKTKVDSTGKPVSVGFKYPNGDTKVRLRDKKEFFWSKNGNETTSHGLFGRDKFAVGSHKYVTVTEGELDALSFYQVLHSPVVSVQSASSAMRDCTVDRAFLNSFERIYLSFDSDQAGREALRSVAKLFDYNKIRVVKFTTRKDPNEFLQASELDELRNIWENAKQYLPDSIVSSLDEFKKIIEEVPKWGMSYPFPTLTQMTYGIRRSESVLITAQEGVGKTELMHAIEHKLLTETNDNVGAIYLEEPKRRHLQALAGVELRKPVHLPDSGCTSSELVSAIEKVVRVDDRLHVYSHFGSDDPEVLLDTIRFLVSARGCVYILLDHISMVVSGLSGEDERKALDYLSTRLEMMVKELDFALIMVSHVNDNGQTRGSRFISKIADVRIDAVRDLLSPDDLLRNTTFLTVAKNRFGMKTGPAGKLVFDPLTYSYQEVDDVFANVA